MIDTQEEFVKKLQEVGFAYKNLAKAIDKLTAVRAPSGREAILLMIVRKLCARRLRELIMILPDNEIEKLLE